MYLIKETAIAMCLCVTTQIWAQDRIPILRGEVKDLGAGEAPGLMVELESLEMRVPKERSFVQNDGSFEFRQVSPGSYFARIVTVITGELIVERLIQLSAETGPVELRMPTRALPARTGTGVVSVQQLRVPNKAMHAFIEAQKFSESGSTEQAIQQLRVAIKLYPNFADAHTNLGAHYVREGKYLEGLAEFRLAATLKPDSALVHTNLAYAFLGLQRGDEAENELRLALAADPKYARAHYLLGHVLALRRGGEKEVVEHLCAAAPEIAAAARDVERMQIHCRAAMNAPGVSPER